MANIKSAKKRIHTSERNRKRNISRRSSLKTLLKKVSSINEEKDLKPYLSEVYHELDRAPYQVFHPNKVNRLKSQIARKVKAKLASSVSV
ncbi:MAG: 30S ribosomal protein S20 [Candidatus Caenarcaniphilales bacterium]|nr:30S ribosomal protein S20 [Candidatus Caenarcaniphilales bacterium]